MQSRSTAGNAWVTNDTGNTVTKLSNTGAVLSGANGYTVGGLNGPYAIAIDGAGNAWVPNFQVNTVTELSNTGAVLSGTGHYTGGGLTEPDGIAIDGSGNVWVANFTGNTVTEMVGIGSPVITPIAAGLPVIPTTDGTSNLGTRP